MVKISLGSKSMLLKGTSMNYKRADKPCVTEKGQSPVFESTGYNRQSLQDQGFKDDWITDYFYRKVDNNGVANPDVYYLKQDLYSGANKINTVAELLEVLKGGNVVECRSEKKPLTNQLDSNDNDSKLPDCNQKKTVAPLTTSKLLPSESYTKQQLLKMGFSEEWITASYFNQSCKDFASQDSVVLTLKPFLFADGVKINTIQELLDALVQGKVVSNIISDSVKIASLIVYKNSSSIV